MKLYIHPRYSKYETFIRSIPQENYERETVFCNRRNVVEKVRVEEQTFVIKKFKRPTWANCLIYTWFRRSKPRRAFENAQLLLEKGFETARPVAYIEIKRWGFFHTGYFISEFLPYPLLRELMKKENHFSPEEREQFEADFIVFTAQLHKKGILPLDYNSGNIFYYHENGKYRFALIDINRMKHGKQPKEKASMRSFVQLGVNFAESVNLIKQYAALRCFNLEECLFFGLLQRFKINNKRKFKHLLHQCLGK